MKRVTRNIEPESAHNLLRSVPRACMAFADEEGPQVQPVMLIWQDDRYRIGVPESAARQPAPNQEVVLLVDEGVYFFDLRAIYVRGAVQPVQPPSDGAPGCFWFELIPSKTVAWDYGAMRKVDDER
jgi:hypothetical protein